MDNHIKRAFLILNHQFLYDIETIYIENDILELTVSKIMFSDKKKRYFDMFLNCIFSKNDFP